MHTRNYLRIIVTLFILLGTASSLLAQERARPTGTTLYEVPPRWLADLPTAGTLPRRYFNMGVRIEAEGGAVGYTDIGLSNRLTVGISYGGERIISAQDPDWNPTIEFNIKFRIIDELEYFPALTLGFASQGYGAYSDQFERYAFKSRGFFAVASRSFYFYTWTSGWHVGVNYSREYDVDDDNDVNIFGGIDFTFRYNLGVALEYDAALNDDKSAIPSGEPNSFGGKGRGYLSLSVKWLFHENLELEALMKDLLVNRRPSETFTREIRLTYISEL